MPRHNETRALPYGPQAMFDLVADVGRYQDFLPWVTATRVRARTDTTLTADLVVGFKMLRETFTSKVNLDPPERIHIEYLDGPLKYLRNDWRFRPDGKGGSIIDFCVDFEFRSRMFETLAGAVFGEAVRRMVGAFEARAHALYGDAPGSSSSSAHRTA